LQTLTVFISACTLCCDAQPSANAGENAVLVSVTFIVSTCPPWAYASDFDFIDFIPILLPILQQRAVASGVVLME